MAIKHTAFLECQKNIDLDGPDGNANMLIQLADSTAHQLDYNQDERKKLKEDMMSSDYVHLVLTFNEHFGHYFTLYTKNVDIINADFTNK
jgi:hypothetical protein